MWPSRKPAAQRLSDLLARHHGTVRRLPGVARTEARDTLAWQMVASLRRLDYTRLLKQRPIDPARADPASPLFDPERAAILYARNGKLDEAIWLVFLATHFGKHARSGWQRLREVYAGSNGRQWTWAAYSADPAAFRRWLGRHEAHIGGGFGNHRKYASLRADSEQGTPAVLESYLAWVGQYDSHGQLVADLVRSGGNDPHAIFDQFYRGMQVKQFGRLGKFDFLALIGRLDLAPITPGSAYLEKATGPLAGARLLYGDSRSADLDPRRLDGWLIELDRDLAIGMQAMEDALCNWQKSPTRFIHFKG